MNIGTHLRKTNVLYHESFGPVLSQGEKDRHASEYLDMYLKRNDLGGSTMERTGPSEMDQERVRVTLKNIQNFPLFAYSVDHTVHGQVGIGLVSPLTTPSAALARKELQERTRLVLEGLQHEDQEILCLRHFDQICR